MVIEGECIELDVCSVCVCVCACVCVRACVCALMYVDAECFNLEYKRCFVSISCSDSFSLLTESIHACMHTRMRIFNLSLEES